ncbi:uncharacterized protein K452DRAFT_356671 [Aplosporella prunicola CBS 121167]|uniref:Uncharacterized protein n=1 Tax=Aplosporella prunicola CBS 121167 TaxID=1176127 RepID=A0A6A6BPK8_9PEZI|nr:uncharacterized protein K452DRAFT_356671 [Aplosporella prunicola CBS 121167]KAF2144491.1 hypothetical protein K452DRAFT_356671 [Aplosporella prunicola CBS 121167]
MPAGVLACCLLLAQGWALRYHPSIHPSLDNRVIYGASCAILPRAAAAAIIAVDNGQEYTACMVSAAAGASFASCLGVGGGGGDADDDEVGSEGRARAREGPEGETGGRDRAAAKVSKLSNITTTIITIATVTGKE